MTGTGVLGRVIAMAVLALAGGAASASAAAAALATPESAAARPNIARVISTTHARSAPGSGSVLMTVRPVGPLAHGATQLRIMQRRTIGSRRYLRVLLPQRPSGSSGWISADKVVLLNTRYHVTIDRGRRRLVVTRDGRVARDVRIVVGKPGSPTPAGEFAISEEVRRRSADDFVGAWVLPLTAFSGTYRQFDGGPGRIAIHGRGGASLLDPLGTARSHGCIRVDNRVVRWLASHLQPGVPVTIR
jgi:lipoprotein-anchoring transpeptidase ErfK/SrfK